MNITVNGKVHTVQGRTIAYGKVIGLAGKKGAMTVTFRGARQGTGNGSLTKGRRSC
jgi:hypothetical protein